MLSAVAAKARHAPCEVVVVKVDQAKESAASCIQEMDSVVDSARIVFEKVMPHKRRELTFANLGISSQNLPRESV